MKTAEEIERGLAQFTGTAEYRRFLGQPLLALEGLKMGTEKKRDGSPEALAAIARGALSCIVEMVQEMNDESKTEKELEEARERIQEDPLSVQVRSGWYHPGDTDHAPEEFNILLGTGGPATRIIGTLSEHGEPETATLQAQDWGTLWTALHDITDEEEAALLRYCQCFYFGEGQ